MQQIVAEYTKIGGLYPYVSPEVPSSITNDKMKSKCDIFVYTSHLSYPGLDLASPFP